MAPDWTKTCPGDTSMPVVPYLTDIGGTTGFHGFIGPNIHVRLYLVDLGDHRLLMARIEANDDAAFQAAQAEATAIIEGVTLQSPTP
jgi:hypothetical protein